MYPTSYARELSHKNIYLECFINEVKIEYKSCIKHGPFEKNSWYISNQKLAFGSNSSGITKP